MAASLSPALASCVGQRRDDVDLDQPFRPRQRDDRQPGRHRMDALEPASDDSINRLAVPDVDEVDRDLADIGEPAAAFREQQRDVGHALLGLAGGIADRDILARVEGLRHLTAQIDRRSGDHRLAEIVVERLLGIGLARIELSDASVGGRLVGRRADSAAIARPPSTRSERPADGLTKDSAWSQSKLRYTAARWAKGGDCAKSWKVSRCPA